MTNYTPDDIEVYRRLGKLWDVKPEDNRGWFIWRRDDFGTCYLIPYSPIDKRGIICYIPPLGWLRRKLSEFGPHCLDFDNDELWVCYDFADTFSVTASTPEGACARALVAILEGKDV